MKEQLTNEEIIRVFALYYGRPFFVYDKDRFNAGERYPVSGRYDEYGSIENLIHYVGQKNTLVMLDLRPLSEISDEDAIEVAKILGINFEVTADDGSLHYYNKIELCFYLDGILSGNEKEGAYQLHVAYQYLISKGYAVPLFFTPNHWANGKTAIELGIAIPETTSHNQQ